MRGAKRAFYHSARSEVAESLPKPRPRNQDSATARETTTQTETVAAGLLPAFARGDAQAQGIQLDEATRIGLVKSAGILLKRRDFRIEQ